MLRLSPGINNGGFFTGSGLGFPFFGDAPAAYLGSTEIDLYPFLASLSASSFAIKSYLRCSRANFGLNSPSVFPKEKLI